VVQMRPAPGRPLARRPFEKTGVLDPAIPPTKLRMERPPRKPAKTGHAWPTIDAAVPAEAQAIAALTATTA